MRSKYLWLSNQRQKRIFKNLEKRYYMYALLEIPQRLSNDLDDLNMKIYSGDSFEPCGFLSHPYLRFEFRNWKEDLRVEYKGKREYFPSPNTFVLLERKNL